MPHFVLGSSNSCDMGFFQLMRGQEIKKYPAPLTDLHAPEEGLSGTRYSIHLSSVFKFPDIAIDIYCDYRYIRSKL